MPSHKTHFKNFGLLRCLIGERNLTDDLSSNPSTHMLEGED